AARPLVRELLAEADLHAVLEPLAVRVDRGPLGRVAPPAPGEQGRGEERGHADRERPPTAIRSRAAPRHRPTAPSPAGPAASWPARTRTPARAGAARCTPRP